MSETRRLRYTGTRRQTFTEHGIGEVENGSEFDVPAGEAERYLRRPDIEDAGTRRRHRSTDSGEDSGAGQPPALTLTSEHDGPLTETVSADPMPAE